MIGVEETVGTDDAVVIVLALQTPESDAAFAPMGGADLGFGLRSLDYLFYPRHPFRIGSSIHVPVQRFLQLI